MAIALGACAGEMSSPASRLQPGPPAQLPARIEKFRDSSRERRRSLLENLQPAPSWAWALH